MADFEYPITAASAPNSFAIGATGVTGIVATAVVPTIVRLDSATAVVMTEARTDAQLVALMTAFLQRHGAGHDGAGGFPTQASLQEAPTLTEVAAAD